LVSSRHGERAARGLEKARAQARQPAEKELVDRSRAEHVAQLWNASMAFRGPGGTIGLQPSA
jgi:hypothetical protein